MNYLDATNSSHPTIFFPQGKALSWWRGLVLFWAMLGTVPLMGAGLAKNANYVSILSSTPCAEMPRRAAELVVQAKEADRASATLEVVKAAAGINPAAILAVVGCVAEVVPDMAATGAGTATTLEPHLALAIARAAASVAPGEAGPITETVCRVSPADYQSVVLAVVREAPGSDRAVLAGLAEALPELKEMIKSRLAVQDGKQPGAGLVLAEVAKAAKTASLPTPDGQVGRPGRLRATMLELDGFTGAVDLSGQDGVIQPKNVAQP